MTLTTRQPDSVWSKSGPIWHWPLDSQIHVETSVPTASYFWVCPLEQDWPNEPAHGMLPYLAVWSVPSKQRAPPLSSVVVWAGNQNNIVLTCKLQNKKRSCLWHDKNWVMLILRFAIRHNDRVLEVTDVKQKALGCDCFVGRRGSTLEYRHKQQEIRFCFHVLRLGDIIKLLTLEMDI